MSIPPPLPLSLRCFFTLFAGTASLHGVEIQAPDPSADFPQAYDEGDPITFTATGSGGAVLNWTSDVDGLIGTGDSFTNSSLSPGSHVVTAVPDGGGPPVDEVRLTVIDDTAITPAAPIKLFDGATMNGLYGWMQSTAYNVPSGVFNLSPGVLNVKAFEDGYLASHNSYRDYVMVFEFRWGTETYADRATKARDSGLIIHSHGSDGTWNNRYLPGLEVQVMEGGMGDIILLEEDVPITAMMPIENVGCGPSTLWNCRGGDRYKDDGSMRTLNQDLHAVHWRLWDKNWSDTKGFRGVNDLDVPYDQNGDPTDEWNRMVTVSNGTQVTVFFNGQLVSECFAVSPDEGKVQVQLERAEYDIGRWELLPLSALDGPSIPTGLPAADLNQPYSETVATSGGVSPYTWSILSGDLPTGLALDPDTGVVAGTPTVEETTVFTLQATDSIGNTATLATSLSVGSGSTTPIENWRQQYFGTTSSTGDAANGFDGDLDGWVNLIEFGLNGIPGATNDHQKYRPSRVAVGDDEYLVLTFPVRDGAVFSTQVAEVDGIRYTLFANDEAGFDGTPLSVVEHTPVQSAGMPTPDPGWSYRSFRIVDPLELRPRAFMQVGVEEITP